MCLEIGPHGQGHDLLALARLDIHILRIEGALVLAAAQIGNANARDHSSVELIRRKRAGTTQHRARNTSLRKHLPHWKAFALIQNLRRGKGIL